MKVFVSYSHKDGEFVLKRLVPVLKAGGVEVVVDRERFEAGGNVYVQMDGAQDAAEKHILCVSADWAASTACRRELMRAVGKDPDGRRHLVVPVRLDATDLPGELADGHRIYVALQDTSDAEQWQLLLSAAGGRLEVDAPRWLDVRLELLREVNAGNCVNLVTYGRRAGSGSMLRQLAERDLKGLCVVDLEDGRTARRRGFLQEILRSAGSPNPSLPAGDDLGEFQARIEARPGRLNLAIEHFDIAGVRWRKDFDLFGTLRNLTSTKRKLLLIFQSHEPFASILASTNPCSSLDVKTIDLR